MKNYILLIITIIFFASISRSQNKMGGESHTYTTNQAWQLALQFNPEKIYSTMNTHMSNIQDGVYLEDQNNIVYDYGFLCNLGHTATHFWDADAGDTQFFTFDLCLVNHECSYDNSYQKILRYWNGGYEIVLTKNFNPAVGCQGGSCGYGVWKIYLEYSSLPNAYKNNQLMVTKMLKQGANGYINFNPPVQYFTLFYDNNLGIINSKNFCWNIAGRIVHLLEDSSVPAHVHDDIHPNDEPPCTDNPDYYEWTYLSAHHTDKTWEVEVPIFL